MNSSHLIKLKENVLNVLQQNPDGVSQNTFDEKIPNMKAEQLLTIITDLLSNSQIEALANKKSKEVFYKLKNSKIFGLEKKLKPEESRVNNLVREAGSKGISPNVIKKSTKMKEVEMQKIEKRLLEIGLIKLFYGNSQKVYVAIDTNADSSLSETPSALLDKINCETRIDDLEHSVIEYLKMQYGRAVECHTNVKDQHKASIVAFGSLFKVINSSNGKKIREEEMKLLLEGLVNSQKITQIDHFSVIKQQVVSGYSENPKTTFLYRYKPKDRDKLESVSVFPCILCPHKEYCTPGMEISPENCNYLDSFLNCF